MESLVAGMQDVDTAEVTLDIGNLAKEQQDRLRNFIKKHSCAEEDIDDILQQTYLEAIKNKNSFRGGARPETWLFGIAHNLVRNNNRSYFKRPLFQELDEQVYSIPANGACPERITEVQRMLDCILNAFDALSEEMQYLLTLILEQNKSYEDVADIFDVPIGTIRSRLSRVRSHLKIAIAA
ncbi:RNA polymerase sigma factor [Motiliproteus sp. MSK22-1]|uniref:RNA polymerase sigma factor n=1 Tax=Motiliproteus sp. MSK22-1 TaxID=1897630 RepID=UPI0009754B12|nr:sigma-70 family RNA polymerase sigma factor [Motiliproteus sp. MSK22-1]OMH25615.1 hypothetical protein BGP75_24005 [Motiliproteus sp. MSK22-1]